jgi:hypothetical protein
MNRHASLLIASWIFRKNNGRMKMGVRVVENAFRYVRVSREKKKREAFVVAEGGVYPLSLPQEKCREAFQPPLYRSPSRLPSVPLRQTCRLSVCLSSSSSSLVVVAVVVVAADT